MPPKVYKEDLIADYKRLAEELGEAPTKRQYNDRGEYSEAVIYNYYDSMSQLKESLGFDPNPTKIDNEKLLSDLRRVGEKIGRVPPIDEYREHGNHDNKTLKDRFGSWNEVLEAAGFEPTEHSEHWRGNDSDPKGGEWTTTVVCDWCGDVTESRAYDRKRYDMKFCDNQCQADYMSEQTGPDTNAWEGGMVEYECEVCGETAEVVPARADTARFCSYECVGEHHREARSGENSPRWRGGYKRYYGPNWRDQRRKARERDDYRCQVCGMDRAEHLMRWGEEPSVHHIERFSSFDSHTIANQLVNLITLCRRDHTEVECGNVGIPSARKAQFDEWISAV